MYFVTAGFTEPTKTQALIEFLQSARREELTDAMEEEAGVRYLETYFPILGFGEHTYEMWWEIPNWAALDDLRASEAGTAFTERLLEFVDQSKPATSRALRTAEDVQVTEPED